MRKTVMHGLYIIRVTNNLITITNIKTKDETAMEIKDSVFHQLDNKNPGRKVVEHALKVYKRMVA